MSLLTGLYMLLNNPGGNLNIFFFVREIGNTNKAMLPWLFAQKGKYNKMCCPLEPIRPSPAQVKLPKCVKLI